MKLFATIAATSMVSQAMEIVPTNENMDNNKLNKIIPKEQNSDYPNGKIEDEVDEFKAAAAVVNGKDVICLTEEQLNKVAMIKLATEDAEPGKNRCSAENLPVIDWVKDNYEKDIPWKRAKKVFTFLQETRINKGSSMYELPKPMTTAFKEMKLVSTDEDSKGEKIEVPAGVKSFFAFQVNAEPTLEEAQALIEERNEKHGEAVAGEYGSLYLKDFGQTDEYLNQVGQNPGLFTREEKVNNPRELVKIIEAANRLNYQELLNFASAKLASGIRINDLYRLRALFGFSATGDYTDRTYWVHQDGKEPEKVVGFFDLLDEHKWFDPNDDKNALYFSNKDKLTVDESYLRKNVDAAYTKINDNAAAMEAIIAKDYPAWTAATETKEIDGKPVCKRNNFF